MTDTNDDILTTLREIRDELRKLREEVALIPRTTAVPIIREIVREVEPPRPLFEPPKYVNPESTGTPPWIAPNSCSTADAPQDPDAQAWNVAKRAIDKVVAEHGPPTITGKIIAVFDPSGGFHRATEEASP